MSPTVRPRHDDARLVAPATLGVSTPQWCDTLTMDCTTAERGGQGRACLQGRLVFRSEYSGGSIYRGVVTGKNHRGISGSAPLSWRIFSIVAESGKSDFYRCISGPPPKHQTQLF
ncbi:unnamed protein product [Ectocarpus sp. 12 AP-2014]